MVSMLLCSFFELYEFFALKKQHVFNRHQLFPKRRFFSSIEGVGGYWLIPIPTGAHQGVNRFWVPAELFVDLVLEKISKLFESRRDRKSLILVLADN